MNNENIGTLTVTQQNSASRKVFRVSQFQDCEKFNGLKNI